MKRIKKKSKKNVFSTLVILAIVLSAFALPMQALADTGCTSGTSGDDTIVCDTDTTGDVNGDDGDDEITVQTDVTVTGNVGGGFGADEITVEEGATVDGSLQGNGDWDWPCEDEADTITNNGTVTGGISGGQGDDTIINDGTVGSTEQKEETKFNTTFELEQRETSLIKGGEGEDNITNSGTADGIEGNSGNDSITNSGTADWVSGNSGDDTITNSGTTDYVSGNSGDDEITVSGTVTKGVNANRGDDTVILETGVQIGGTIYGSGCEWGAEENVDTLVFNMSTRNEAEYNAAKAVIAGATDEFEAYKFSWDGGFVRWQYFDTLVDKLTLLLIKSGSKPEPKPSPTATLIFVEEGVLKVYQNDASGTLRFYGLGKNSQTFIAELAAQSWENADPGDLLLDIESVELGTNLVVTMLENGQLQVEYFSLADGALLFSKTITP